MNQWHLMYIKPRQEKVRLPHLLNQNFEAYLPLIKKEKISHRKKVLINESAFPRHLFILLNDDDLQNWILIRLTKGVSHLVNFGSHLATLKDQIINHLKYKIEKNLTMNAFSEGDHFKMCFRY